MQRACRAVRLSRAAYYRPPVPASRRDAAVIAALTDVVARYGRWGFWKLFDRMRAEGRRWNHKHVHRVYCALRLNLPRRTSRRVPRRLRQPLVALPVLNLTWAMDFMNETLYDARRVRLLTAIDEGNREALDITAGVSIPSRRVTRVLDALVAVHGCPSAIRVDNELPAKSSVQIFSAMALCHNRARTNRQADSAVRRRHVHHSDAQSSPRGEAATELHTTLKSRRKVRALSTRSWPRRLLAKGSVRLVSSLPGSGDSRCRS